MRPARGRAPAAVAKRTCVVRLEKVHQQSARQDDVADDDRKKMTGPLKKRPVVMKKSPGTSSSGGGGGGGGGIRHTRRRGATEDLSEYMLVTARAKRTPKPNPKYSNEDIVTPRSRGGKGATEESEAEEEDAYQSSEVTEPQEETSEEEFEPSKPVTRGVMRLSNGELIKRGPGRPRKLQLDTPKQPLKRRLDTHDSSKDHLATILAQNKRLNIELYDASDSDISIAAPSPRRVARTMPSTQSQRPVARLTMKAQQPQQKEPQRRFVERRGRQSVLHQPAQISSGDEDDPEEFETTGVASTVDDFETMPTFTIVNINDIINKKGDVMIEQTNRVNNNVPASNKNNQSSSVRKEPKQEERISPTQASRNRRKTMHTTILSDKIDPDKLKNPPPRTPFPPRKPITPQKNLSQTFTKSLLNSNQNHSTAPRILNNVLCRRTKALQAKQEQKQQLQQQDTQSDIAKNTEPRPLLPIKSKENHLNNNFRAASNVDELPPLPPTLSTNRKLPGAKVVVQRQGNKIIKKITCFETWYVINIPNIEAQPPKNHLNMTLMHLANTAKEITLPSSDWNFKVNLQKIPPNQAQSLDEQFTGYVKDMPDTEKRHYVPVSVMFRRAATSNQRVRMPFDRAVIFKNENYYTNIEGKNVRLLGSPQQISTHEDIEILLKIMDEMTLVNPHVEQVTYIL